MAAYFYPMQLVQISKSIYAASSRAICYLNNSSKGNGRSDL
jgi:hypothetical protein